MNNYAYPYIPYPNNNILDELLKINETLKRIESKLDKNEESKKQKKYIEKEDNYYML